jgi:hypothetical protein
MNFIVEKFVKALISRLGSARISCGTINIFDQECKKNCPGIFKVRAH